MIAIPNMEKPKNCFQCSFNDGIYCCLIDTDTDALIPKMPTERLPLCPLIEIVRCGECKYFNLNEWDETICGVPIIVAHEICHKWGDGCKTNIYGFCFMGERRADESKSED